MINSLLNKCKEILNNKIKGCIFLSLILTALYLYGDIVIFDREITFLYLIKYILIFIIYYVAIHFLFYFVSINIVYKKIHEFLEKKTFFKIFIIIFIVWIPHLIIKYPAGNNYDTYQQLLQGLGYEQLGAHYPLFHTLFMTMFYQFGVLIGNANIGMFIFVLLEAIILDLIFSYSIKTIYDNDISDLLILISIVFYCFCPYVVGYIGQSIYDIYYSGFFVLFIIELYKYCNDYSDFWNDKKNTLLFVVSCILMVLFRKNGIYVIIPTCLVILIRELKNDKKFSKKILIMLICLIIPIILNNTLESIYKPKKASIREALSIPFQQTARFAKYHDDLVTEEEKEIINVILPYDRLAKLYKEFISDPVKGKYNDNATINDLMNYFGVWFKHFLRSPLTYFDATGRSCIYLFYPRYSTYVYFIDCNNGLVDNQNDGLLQTPLLIKNQQENYLEFLNFLHIFPLTYFINNMATFVLMFVCILMFIINDKTNNILLVCIPIIISVLIVIASPGIKIHARYSYPILWSFPIWISLVNKKSKINK